MPVEISASEEMEPAGIVMSMVGGLLVVEVRLARSCLMAGAGGSRGCDHLQPFMLRPSVAGGPKLPSAVRRVPSVHRGPSRAGSGARVPQDRCNPQAAAPLRNPLALSRVSDSFGGALPQIEEIFGPVQSPFYTVPLAEPHSEVRATFFCSAHEAACPAFPVKAPAVATQALEPGTCVFFVKERSSFMPDLSSLCAKGYDAAEAEGGEEVEEFSDDEQEAAVRMQTPEGEGADTKAARLSQQPQRADRQAQQLRGERTSASHRRPQPQHQQQRQSIGAGQAAMGFAQPQSATGMGSMGMAGVPPMFAGFPGQQAFMPMMAMQQQMLQAQAHQGGFVLSQQQQQQLQLQAHIMQQIQVQQMQMWTQRGAPQYGGGPDNSGGGGGGGGAGGTGAGGGR